MDDYLNLSYYVLIQILYNIIMLIYFIIMYLYFSMKDKNSHLFYPLFYLNFIYLNFNL